jgi:hypothetical protein
MGIVRPSAAEHARFALSDGPGFTAALSAQPGSLKAATDSFPRALAGPHLHGRCSSRSAGLFGRGA